MFGSNCNTASVPLVANIDGNGNNNGWGAEGSWLWFIIVIFANAKKIFTNTKGE